MVMLSVEYMLNRMAANEFEVIDINTLAGVCGYFTGATDANNGYGCNHPEQERIEELYDGGGYTCRGFEDDVSKPKVRQGMCFASSCPFAFHCTTIEDMKIYAPETAEEIISNNPNKDSDELDDIAAKYELLIVMKADIV